jgi:hypothetical protein
LGLIFTTAHHGNSLFRVTLDRPDVVAMRDYYGGVA